MAGLNRVMLIGRLGKDPELRYTQSDKPVTNFSIATTEKFGDKEYTEWHNITVWGKLAEVCNDYLRKGREIFVEGRIQSKEWEDKNGNKRISKDIVAGRVVFLGNKEDGDQGGNQTPRNKPRHEDAHTGSQDYGSPPADNDYPF